MPAASDALWTLTATQLLDGYRNREFSPVEVALAVLERIEAFNPELNAFRLVSPTIVDDARASESRWQSGRPQGVLDGVPVSIKDVLLTKGWPTLKGSRTVEPRGPWNEDAPAVARLREQGAILLGKTTTPEFGWKGVTDSPLTGITRNPWDSAKTPGGSSGGAAAAVASGMGPIAVGTDGGGSIRIPSSFTGLFGFKATFGRVPAWPLSSFGTVGHVCPMTRSVGDTALLLNVLSQPDSRDWHSLPYDARDWRSDIEGGIAGLRIAYSSNLGYASVDSEVAALVRDAALALEDLGAIVEERHPGFENPAGMFHTLWFASAAFVLKGVKNAELVDPGFREIASEGEKITAYQVLDLQKRRADLGSHMGRFHRDYDLLVTPTLAVPAFEAGREFPDGCSRWTDWTPFTFPFNLTQQPAASIPCGFTRSGLPVGLQIIGPKYGEARVLRAARAFESLRPISMPPKPP